MGHNCYTPQHLVVAATRGVERVRDVQAPPHADADCRGRGAVGSRLVVRGRERVVESRRDGASADGTFDAPFSGQTASYH